MKNHFLILLIFLLANLSGKANTNNDINQQLASLFSEMENGFKNQMKDGEQHEGYIAYTTNLSTDFSETGAVIKKNNDVVFFNSYIIENKEGGDKWKHKDQLAQAIERYTGLKGFQVRTAFKDERHLEYIVTKSTGTIGFIQLFKTTTSWTFLLFLPLDQQQLKTSIQNGLESAKNGFNSIQGKLLQTTSHGIKEHESTKKTYAALGSQIDHVLHNRAWLNKYQLYPFSALRHQVLQMDLNIIGYSRSKEEKDNRLKLQFKQSSIELLLMVYGLEGSGSMLGINFSDETKKKKPITAQELNPTIVSHLKKGMDNIKRVTGYITQIEERIALLDKNKKNMNMRSAQTMLRPAWQPFNMINSYLYDAEGEINNALNLAHQVDCIDTKVAINALYDRVGKARSNFLDANKAFKVGTTARGNDYIVSQLDLASDKLQSGIREYNRINDEIEKINENPCYKTDLVNSPEGKEKPKVKKQYHYVGLHVGEDDAIDFIKVVTVRDGTAASKAGIQEGDIVLKVGRTSMEDLFAKFAQGFFKDQIKGKKIKVEIYSQRDDKIKIFNLETGKDGQFELIKEAPYTPIVKEIEYSEGDYYKGETRFGNPEGQGYYKFSNGIFYEGEFSKGQFHGYGITTFPDGDFYEGNFINGRKEGIFIYRLEGKMYNFEYKNNKEQSRTLIEGEETLAKVRKEIKNSNKEKETIKKLPTTRETTKPEYIESGIYVLKGKAGENYKISTIAEGSPASKTHMEKGDEIVKINDKEIRNLSESAVKQLLKIKKGESLKLTFSRFDIKVKMSIPYE